MKKKRERDLPDARNILADGKRKHKPRIQPDYEAEEQPQKRQKIMPASQKAKKPPAAKAKAKTVGKTNKEDAENVAPKRSQRK